MYESLKAGEILRIPTKPTLADGLAIAEAGKLCLEMTKEVVEQIFLVDEVQIATSVLRLLELEKTVVEGAGAVPLAAAMNKSLELAGKKVVLCLCGGNIDVHLISRVIERGLAADGRLCRITCLHQRSARLAGANCWLVIAKPARASRMFRTIAISRRAMSRWWPRSAFWKRAISPTSARFTPPCARPTSTSTPDDANSSKSGHLTSSSSCSSAFSSSAGSIITRRNACRGRNIVPRSRAYRRNNLSSSPAISTGLRPARN
jgi:hypothetical protein